MSGLGSPQIFFGRCESWSEDDGWETVEGVRDFEEAAAKFAKKWDLDDGDKFSVIKAAPDGRQEFAAQKRLAVNRLPVIPPDDSPDSQR